MWFKVDDGFHSSRKLLSIPKRHRLAAAGLWVIAGSWCGQQLTNGRVPDYMLKEWGATPATVQALIDSGLWEVESDSNVFYKWDEYQPRKADVDAERAASRERMRNLRAMRKQGKQQDSGDKQEMFTRTAPNCSENVSNPDPTRPDPTRPIYTEAKASGDFAAEPEQLFNEPEPAVPEPEIIREDAGAIIAQWIESQSQRPPGRVIGQLSKEIKTLLNEGHAFSEVLEATQAWSKKALHPSTLASVLHEVRNPRTMTNGSEKRLQQGMDLVQRVAARGAGAFDENPFERKELE